MNIQFLPVIEMIQRTFGFQHQVLCDWKDHVRQVTETSLYVLNQTYFHYQLSKQVSRTEILVREVKA